MSIHIKKINRFTSFCGLDNVTCDEEFQNYNVIFANNGSGKTSVTRALELLIQKNTHISKYQSINSQIAPSIEFELSDRILNINDSTNLPILPFNIEVYNSDFLQYNAPLSSEFGLKKLDDETIVLEGSAIGEETKEIEELNKQKIKLEDKISRIGNIRDIENLDENSDIRKEQIKTLIAIKDIEKIRKNITSSSIQIKAEDFEIISDELNDISKYNYDEKKLVDAQKEFDDLNEAIKEFDSLTEIQIASLVQLNNKTNIDSLFDFDMEKEAGQVSEKIKAHILKVGEQFVKDGRKIIKDILCPFCNQPIKNGILDEYTNYFNEAVNNFDNLSQKLEIDTRNELEKWNECKNQILEQFQKFKPFLDDFEANNITLTNSIDEIIKQTKHLKELIADKKGINNQEQYGKQFIDIYASFGKVNKIIDLTIEILESKKEQEYNLKVKKQEFKNIKIQKAKKDSFNYQKTKTESLEKIKSLENEFLSLDETLVSIKLKIQELQNKRRPDVQQINLYLKALNLSKYSVNEDYKITISSSSIIENDNLRLVLSEGEKTTITFAYFLARLKLFYNKSSLKNLVIVIDDPISSLDEHRVYNTSYIVSKINQEIAGEILDRKDDKAQVFVLTHSHLFMTNIIRILGKNTSYFQLDRQDNLINFISKNKVAGYFDTFYLLLFKEILTFAENSTINENFNESINYGNKIRILIESFMKTNFISKFIEQEYKNQSSFDLEKLRVIIQKISSSNVTHIFANSYFEESEYKITNDKDLELKLDSVVKGLHMDSHGSIADFYNQYKLSIFEVQKLAKITINVMTALNPNQTYFYIEASKN
ncbi:hypothetical protein SMGD1_2820 [Sulfurimonas gotlandica GD1]|uniref:Protein CR006 P-loop domain-containing protein n=1 Tax=Sulfurimonas gotlandica (strain DSM 19862 / JCM 16533 / GD1) TaxID=929558 RepID=B6BJU2_SULGG|nr:AAA family ATPase [Sulfurimonas gotlandica]EDZ62617.1 conserved hypothetical protein [Sulfurimonas gotlandica GD1]EHP31342.1 hypothetical protein SMGD1_2820 [Sulfurimonas gotlandica GD1]